MKIVAYIVAGACGIVAAWQGVFVPYVIGGFVAIVFTTFTEEPTP